MFVHVFNKVKQYILEIFIFKMTSLCTCTLWNC